MPPTYTYSDLADLALASDATAHVKIKAAKRLKGELAPGLAAGSVRYLVTADVVALLAAKAPLPNRLRYIIDLPPDSLGRLPKVKKGEAFIFGAPARPGELRLVAPDAQLPWTMATADRLRAILTEASAADAPPRVRGVESGFHSAGALPGEGESQIFLAADGNRLVSLTIVRSPNVAPRWFVSLGEVVDEASGPPKRDTLLWYRLACFLPREFPVADVAAPDAPDAAIVAEDYRLVMNGLGACNRLRKPPPGL